MTFDLEHKDFLLRNLDTVYDIFEALYDSPDHGNKSNPMDELIYIHLSQRTREKGYAKAYERLSKAFPEWKGLAQAEPLEILRLVKSSGLGKTRANQISSNARIIKDRFGNETLEMLRRWPEKKIFEFLIGLKGIGPKSALCIMMYSLDKKVFPVDTHVNRVCQRLGFIEQGTNHKIAQRDLSSLFPEEFRYGLHVNMVAHGRKNCKGIGFPRCESCELRKFCRFYRSGLRKKLDSKNPKMMDLFCGPGGASSGLRDAGFDIAFATDISRSATDTYYLNHPEITFKRIHTGDIRKLDVASVRRDFGSGVDLIFAGPPCQGWSRIGKTRKNGNNGNDFFDDGRNALFFEFVRMIDGFSPTYFVMENVPGLETAHNGKYIKIMEREFQNHGYLSKRLTLNAANYGVPQNRSRVFFIGHRVGGGRELAEKALSEIEASIFGDASEKKVSFRRGMRGLPHLGPGEGANVLRTYGMRLQGGGRDRKRRLVYNHITRKHNERDLRIYEQLMEGEDYLPFSRRTKNLDLLPYPTESFHTKFRKIRGDQPCYTVIAHLSKDSNSYIHPDDNRGLTVREAARLQSFQDDYIFLAEGFRQFIQVGNALPSRMANAIGKAIMKAMAKEEWQVV